MGPSGVQVHTQKGEKNRTGRIKIRGRLRFGVFSHVGGWAKSGRPRFNHGDMSEHRDFPTKKKTTVSSFRPVGILTIIVYNLKTMIYNIINKYMKKA